MRMDMMSVSLLALFTSAALYVLLVYTRRSVERFPSHSLALRGIIALVCWIFVVSLLVYLLSVLTLIWIFFTEDPMSGFSLIFHLIIWFLGARLYAFYDERWEITETAAFIGDGIFFLNYMRRRDHDIQHELDRWNTGRVYREVTGKEITPEILQTFQDTVTREKRTDERIHVRNVIQHRHDELLKQLNTGISADAGEVFRFELMTNTANPLLPLMKEFVIDTPRTELAISLILPETSTINLTVPPIRNRFIGNLYVALQIFLSLEWLRQYDRFVQSIRIIVFQSHLDDDARYVYRDVASIRWDVQRIRERGEKITGVSDLEQLGEMRFY
jgi:membrane protein YdbS with pleckstrin-like domain